jgi:hypothetical protein
MGDNLLGKKAVAPTLKPKNINGKNTTSKPSTLTNKAVNSQKHITPIYPIIGKDIPKRQQLC